MNVFEEKVVMTVIELKFVCQTSSIVFFLRSVHELFFMLSLIDSRLWQILVNKGFKVCLEAFQINFIR